MIHECKNIEEVRSYIDDIDHEVISLLGKRFQFVKQASTFKKNEDTVKAPERFKAMLIKRREWAAEQNLNQDVIENLYKDLVSYFIEEELKAFKSKI